MQTIAKPHLVAYGSHDHFRFRIFPLDHRHDLGAVLWGDYISTHADCPLDPIESLGRESQESM
jgi:hypothetical protein